MQTLKAVTDVKLEISVLGPPNQKCRLNWGNSLEI